LSSAIEPNGQNLRRGQTGVQPPRPASGAARNAGLDLPERLEKLAQIRKSATDYEAIFVDQLVKLMRPSPLAQTPGGETFSEIAEQPFRDFLSRAGGLGLSGAIVSQIARQEGLEETLREHPEVMGPGWRLKIPPSLMKKSPGGLTLAPSETREDQNGPSADSETM
jgi:Rod binding domain-containing protein